MNPHSGLRIRASKRGFTGLCDCGHEIDESSTAHQVVTRWNLECRGIPFPIRPNRIVVR